MTRISMAVLPALLLAGCAVGPNYKRPAVAVPDQYRGRRRRCRLARR